MIPRPRRYPMRPITPARTIGPPRLVEVGFVPPTVDLSWSLDNRYITAVTTQASDTHLLTFSAAPYAARATQTPDTTTSTHQPAERPTA